MIRSLPLLTLALSLPLASSGLESPLRVTVAGSSTVAPLLKSAAKAYRDSGSEVQLIVSSTSSTKGIAATAKGEVAIGMASRDLRGSEREAFPTIQTHPIAIDGVALVVHGSNPVTAISKDQARGVFLGLITNWSELGGQDAPIVPLSITAQHATCGTVASFLGLEVSSSDRASISLRPAGDTQAKPFLVAAADGNQAVLAKLVRSPHGLAYASYAAANTLALRSKGKAAALLTLDGVPPSEKNIKDGRYPLLRSLLLLSRGDPSSELRDLLGYFRAEKGRQLVIDQGFLPVTQ